VDGRSVERISWVTKLPAAGAGLSGYPTRGKGGKFAMRGTQTVAKVVHASLSRSAAEVSGGGQFTRTWHGTETPWPARPYSPAPSATA